MTVVSAARRFGRGVYVENCVTEESRKWREHLIARDLADGYKEPPEFHALSKGIDVDDGDCWDEPEMSLSGPSDPVTAAQLSDAPGPALRPREGDKNPWHRQSRRPEPDADGKGGVLSNRLVEQAEGWALQFNETGCETICMGGGRVEIDFFKSTLKAPPP